MATTERATRLSLTLQHPLIDRPLGAGQETGRAFRLCGADTGWFVLGAAIYWGLAPLLVMGLLLAGEAVRLVRDTLGMAGPGGELSLRYERG